MLACGNSQRICRNLPAIGGGVFMGVPSSAEFVVLGVNQRGSVGISCGMMFSKYDLLEKRRQPGQTGLDYGPVREVGGKNVVVYDVGNSM